MGRGCRCSIAKNDPKPPSSNPMWRESVSQHWPARGLEMSPGDTFQHWGWCPLTQKKSPRQSMVSTTRLNFQEKEVEMSPWVPPPSSLSKEKRGSHGEASWEWEEPSLPALAAFPSAAGSAPPSPAILFSPTGRKSKLPPSENKSLCQKYLPLALISHPRPAAYTFHNLWILTYGDSSWFCHC